MTPLGTLRAVAGFLLLVMAHFSLRPLIGGPVPLDFLSIAVLFAAGEGYTDTIAVEDVPRYADALLARIHRTYPELHALVHSGKKLPPEALERLRELAAETLKNL